MNKRLWIIEDMVDLQPVYKNIFDNESYDLRFFKSFDEFSRSYQNDKMMHIFFNF